MTFLASLMEMSGEDTRFDVLTDERKEVGSIFAIQCFIS